MLKAQVWAEYKREWGDDDDIQAKRGGFGCCVDM